MFKMPVDGIQVDVPCRSVLSNVDEEDLSEVFLERWLPVFCCPDEMYPDLEVGDGRTLRCGLKIPNGSWLGWSPG
jgi:hypothetical protein